jgi:aminopeptidase N
LTFHLTAPLEYTAIANGALMKEEIHGALKTTHYELKVPCPSYLICLAVGEFTSVVDKPFKDIPIAYFAVKGTPADWLTRGLGKTRGMMEWLTKKLDTSFPWPKYYQIASPLISGAMENISFVTWNETYCLLDETFAKERQWLSDLVNIHEMAHTYFGDLLVIR